MLFPKPNNQLVFELSINGFSPNSIAKLPGATPFFDPQKSKK